MGLGAVLEPLIVVSLLGGGTLVNRDSSTRENDDHETGGWSSLLRRKGLSEYDAHDIEGSARSSSDTEGIGLGSWTWQKSSSSSSLGSSSSDTAVHDPTRRERKLHFFKWQAIVSTPNTEVFKERLLSRVLRRFPFLVEAWYWALIYWVYQLGRAFTALTLDSSTVDVARQHALQVIHLEQRLHLLVEVPVQQWFLERPTFLHWTNRTYSFIHIPGTILFLIVLYYLTTTRPNDRLRRGQADRALPSKLQALADRVIPDLYERRRRTMAMCNLLAFVVFTFWPCMPPRLLSDPEYVGPDAPEAQSFGFVDTVHGAEGESSVWTTNRFCNQYAAMPSLHFGYSFLIGLSIANMPLENSSWQRRLVLVWAGMLYPAIILTAIIATANHFVLDAVAGACVCGLAWHCNTLLLNLLPLEDYFLSALRMHKPEKTPFLGKVGLLRS